MRTLVEIAGHSSIAMSAAYVHPDGEAVLEALTRMDETVKAAPKKLPARRQVAKISTPAPKCQNALG